MHPMISMAFCEEVDIAPSKLRLIVYVDDVDVLVLVACKIHDEELYFH